MAVLCLSFTVIGGLVGCGNSESEPPKQTEKPLIGRCIYTNPFSKAEECKDYSGTYWAPLVAKMECAAAEPFGAEGVFEEGVACSTEGILGRCLIGEGTERAYDLVFKGTDAGACSTTQAGCETFAGGKFQPAEICGGEPTGPSTSRKAFVPPYLDCRDPLPGEGPGNSDGKICTHVLVSGCTEPGRRFDDYASCDDVRTQRPFFSYPVTTNTSSNDQRLSDQKYMEEVKWAAEQTAACSCVCCHSDKSKGGASGWSIDAGPIWIDSVSDSGLAMMAGLVDSTAFGTYPPSQNNGFDRATTGLPTTDVNRMQAFLLAEYRRRDFKESDAQQYTPFGGPLYDQLIYQATDCKNGEGIATDGSVTWGGGAARYIYVLEMDSSNPGAPPNLDLPQGTVWRLDVPPTAAAMRPTLKYGEAPSGTKQKFPEAGSPAKLEPGKKYYLYVLADIGLPITRCLFQAP